MNKPLILVLVIAAVAFGWWQYGKRRRRKADKASGGRVTDKAQQTSQVVPSDRQCAETIVTDPAELFNAVSVEIAGAKALDIPLNVGTETATTLSEPARLPTEDAVHETIQQPSSDQLTSAAYPKPNLKASNTGAESAILEDVQLSDHRPEGLPRSFDSALVVPPMLAMSTTPSNALVDQFGDDDQTLDQPGKVGTKRVSEVLSGNQEGAEADDLSQPGVVVAASAENRTDLPHTPEPNTIVKSWTELSPSIVEREETTPIASVQTPQAPTYHPLSQVPASAPRRTSHAATVARASTSTGDLRLRLQLVFGRGGEVKTLALVPDRRDQMPPHVEVSGTQGELRLTELSNEYYEPVSLSDVGGALSQGIEWRGRSAASSWRWVLGRRELYVFVPGDEFGLHGFISTARLWLNARHVIFAEAGLREEVLAALSEAGCTAPELCDETTHGVPRGWILFRNVTPTRAVPMRASAHILNALCALPDVEPHFTGGIHLERGTWLFGYPPRIRLTGDLRDVEIKLDGKSVLVGPDGDVSVAGWDTEGDHQLWFGSQTQMYTLRTTVENWQSWPAHNFGMGAAICGGSIDPTDRNSNAHQTILPMTNPLLIGANPGEVFQCCRGDDVRLQTFVTFAPFQPVWALPSDPAHADKRNARILLLQAMEPALPMAKQSVAPSRRLDLQKWFSVLNAASKKRLRIEPDSEDAAALWIRYRAAARQLRRKLL